MINNERILAVIPARGNSKAIKNKNIIEFCGKPLIAHTIECSLHSRYVDETVVTTDSPTIRDVALEWGARAPFLRPEEMATDTSDTAEAVWHAAQTLAEAGEHFDIVVLLQPTSPLRTTEELDGALEHFIAQGKRGLVSISESTESPLLMRRLVDDGTKMKKLLNVGSTLPRQSMPVYYVVNGSIYINRADELTPTISFNDNEVFYCVDPAHAVDINDPVDLIVAEFYRRSDPSNADSAITNEAG